MKSSILATSPQNTRTFDTSIAAALGNVNAAIIVQQLHYWMGKEGVGTVINKIKYIYNTYQEWVEQFSWLSVWQFRSAMNLLRELEIVKVIRHKAPQWNQTNYYTLDRDRLLEILNNKTSLKENKQKEAKKINKVTSESNSADNNKTTAEQIKKTHQNSISNSTFEQKAINSKWKEQIEELDQMGVGINKTLISLVKMYSEEEVDKAVALLKVRKREQHIPNPGGYLTAALKESWANAVSINTTKDPEQVSATEVFRLWYDLAKELGYCTSQEIREGEQWVLLSGTWERWSSAISRGYSLDYLKGVMKKNKQT